MNPKPAVKADPEIEAISVVYDALSKLEPSAQRRVLEYVAGKLGVPAPSGGAEPRKPVDYQEPAPAGPRPTIEVTESDEAEGISPVALKWMKRNGFTAAALSGLFSLGVDEIDLVAKTVPGANKRQRMHSVLLLKGIAAYLSTGVARVSHEQVKEACLHYDAFDTANFAAYLKSFAAEVAGSKESGYTLTARGLTNATDLIKTLMNVKA